MLLNNPCAIIVPTLLIPAVGVASSINPPVNLLDNIDLNSTPTQLRTAFADPVRSTASR